MPLETRDNCPTPRGRGTPRPGTLSVGQTRGLKLADPGAIPATLERIGRRVLRGELDHRLANCYGYLASIAIRAHDVADLQERLALLEEHFGAAR